MLHRAIDWEAAYELMGQAESQEAKDEIERTVKSLYHKDHD